MNAIVKVPFYGDELTAVETAEATFVAVRPICDRLGLDWSAQFRKLTKAERRWSVAVMATETAAGERESVCIPVSKLFGWLASIEPSRVKPELRERLELYQDEADAVLDRHFRLRSSTLSAEHAVMIAALDDRLTACHGHMLAKKPLWARIKALYDAGTARDVTMMKVRGSRTHTDVWWEMSEMERCGLIDVRNWYAGPPRTAAEDLRASGLEIFQLQERLAALEERVAVLPPAGQTASA